MQSTKFTVPKPGLVLFVIISVLSLTLSMKLRLSAEEMGRAAGSIAGLLLWSTLLSWVAWRVARRSELLKNIVFYIVLAVLGTGQVLRPVHALKHQKTAGEFREAIELHQDELRREFEAEGSLSADSSRTDRLIQNIENSAEGLAGAELGIVNASTRLLKTLRAYEQAYQEAAEKLPGDAIISPEGITNVTQLDHYRQIVDRFMTANEELAQISSQSASLLKKELMAQGVKQRSIDAAMRGYSQSFIPRQKIIAEIRAQDAQLGTNLLAILDLYESNWGKWSYSHEDELAVFQDEVPDEQYAAAIESILLLSTQQQASQQELVNLPPAPR